MVIDLAMPILVIDDSPVMGQILCKLLDLIGFTTIDNVLDCPSAAALLREKRYGLMIADWDMKELSRITADATLQTVPLIVIATESTLPSAMTANITANTNYLIKPFTQEALKNKIDEIFDSRRAP